MTSSVENAVKENFVQQAKDCGYQTEALVWVDQTENNADRVAERPVAERKPSGGALDLVPA